MPKKHHRLVLGVLDDIPRGIQLCQALLEKGCGHHTPIILSQSSTGEHDRSLSHAGLAASSSIEGIRIHHTTHDVVQPSLTGTSPEDLIKRLVEHSPEIFWSLVDDFLSKGKVLVALNLQGMQEIEIAMTKMILDYANDRVHLIDLL